MNKLRLIDRAFEIGHEMLEAKPGAGYVFEVTTTNGEKVEVAFELIEPGQRWIESMDPDAPLLIEVSQIVSIRVKEV